MALDPRNSPPPWALRRVRAHEGAGKADVRALARQTGLSASLVRACLRALERSGSGEVEQS